MTDSNRDGRREERTAVGGCGASPSPIDSRGPTSLPAASPVDRSMPATNRWRVGLPPGFPIGPPGRQHAAGCAACRTLVATGARSPMPLQNRVTPFAEIVAVPHRGTMMGNRGIIHDPHARRLLSRRWQHRAWVCCVLAYKDHRHPIMGKSHYTELFFLDEATAFAAGHRPCAFCRRADFVSFLRAWAEGLSLPPAQARAPLLDRRLHRERNDPGTAFRSRTARSSASFPTARSCASTIGHGWSWDRGFCAGPPLATT